MSANPLDWLAKAEGDFHSANWEMKAPAPNFDAVVFHAQQCIEKMIKGILVAAAIPFERTHELNLLAHQVRQAHQQKPERPAWSWDPADLAAIQPGAVLLRYPDYSATSQDAQRAIDACTRLRASLLPHF